MGEVLSLARPRESTQREGRPTTCPEWHTVYAIQGSLCFSGFWAFAQLAGRKIPRPAQTGGLTCPQKPCDARLRPREPGKLFLAPSVQPSTAEKTGLSAPPVRARSERSEIGELGARRFFRGAQGTLNGILCMPFRASLRAAFSLATFSWPRKRKYLARKGRNKKLTIIIAVRRPLLDSIIFSGCNGASHRTACLLVHYPWRDIRWMTRWSKPRDELCIMNSPKGRNTKPLKESPPHIGQNSRIHIE